MSFSMARSPTWTTATRSAYLLMSGRGQHCSRDVRNERLAVPVKQGLGLAIPLGCASGQDHCGDRLLAHRSLTCKTGSSARNAAMTTRL